MANMAKFAALGQSLVRTAVISQAALPTNNNLIPSIGSKLKLTTMAPANMIAKQIHLIKFISCSLPLPSCLLMRNINHLPKD